MSKANEHRNAWFEGVQKCHLDENLFTVMERIVRAEVHRLVVVDENEKVIGIISLSDILLYLVLRPSGEGIGGTEQSVRANDPPFTKLEIDETEPTACDHSIDSSLGDDNVRNEEQEVQEQQASEIKVEPKSNNNNENDETIDVNGVCVDDDEDDDDGTVKTAEDHTKSDECLSVRSDSPASLTQETNHHEAINTQVTSREIGLVSE